MNIEYVHPFNKTKGYISKEHVCFENSQDKCPVFDGCYDFASIGLKSEERHHYDDHYNAQQTKALSDLSYGELLKQWQRNSSYKLLLETMGDVGGKTILLLGNGLSTKEFLFLYKGANVVYTDISIKAVLHQKKLFESSESLSDYRNNIIFQTVDAVNLPYANGSFDYIYGCAFVHHLQILDPFLSEVNRCLKDDGKCFFLDDAYSSWWQALKKTVLKPLQIYSHWRTGISPEDLHATKKGGYKKQEILDIMENHGFSDIFYKRSMLFERLLHRGSTKLINPNVSKYFGLMGRSADQLILGKRFLSNNGMLLVWGAKKQHVSDSRIF